MHPSHFLFYHYTLWLLCLFNTWWNNVKHPGVWQHEKDSACLWYWCVSYLGRRGPKPISDVQSTNPQLLLHTYSTLTHSQERKLLFFFQWLPDCICLIIFFLYLLASFSFWIPVNTKWLSTHLHLSHKGHTRLTVALDEIFQTPEAYLLDGRAYLLSWWVQRRCQLRAISHLRRHSLKHG